jgi:dynein heavy chain
VDNPEVFGLHPNADLTFRMKESTEMINTLSETRPKDSGGGSSVSMDELVQEKSREIRTKLPPDYNLVEVRDTIKKTGGPKGLSEKGM